MKPTKTTVSNSTEHQVAESAIRDLNGLKLNIASIGDIHLGHPHTPTAHIIKNIESYAFPYNEETAKLDIIFITGDVTDGPLDAASNSAIIMRAWIARFLRFCAKHDITVLIIEGTPLHEWGQSIAFVEENENHAIGCDLHYIRDIDIVHLDRYGVDVLCIPDEIRPNTAITLHEVKRLLAEKGLDKVHFAVMHGAFDYQLPDVEELIGRKHDFDEYCKIVMYAIFIGHVHQHYPKGIVYPNGSFDRLCHGDEGVKGHVRFNKGVMRFIPNRGAMRYITLDVTGMGGEELLKLIGDRLAGDESKFKIMLKANCDDAAFALVSKLNALFPTGEFDVSRSDKAEVKERREARRVRAKDSLSKLTRDNLHELWLNEIRLTSGELMEECSAFIGKVVHAASISKK